MKNPNHNLTTITLSRLAMELTSGCRHVAVIPHPARGHVNPLINLSRALAATGENLLLITFIVTEDWLDLIASGSAKALPLPSNVCLRSIPNVIPSERARGADLHGFHRAVYTKMEDPVERLIERLEPPVDFVITDSVLVWVANMCKRRSIPVSSVWTNSAAVFLAMHVFNELDASGQLPANLGKEEEALAYLPEVSSLTDRSKSNSSELDMLRLFTATFSWFTTAESLLLTSFYELESNTIDTMKSFLSVPIYSIGPPVPYMALGHSDPLVDADTMKWLDSQAERSVLYIAFGSFFSSSDPQKGELIEGLKASGVRYLWVERDGHQEKPEEPNRGGVGLVVPWSDQLRVLCRPSVGGFLTHCGWNSTLEGVYAGVPMLTFPIAFDQHPNSRLIVDTWGVGLRLKDEGGDEKVVGSEEVAEKVRKLMGLDAEEESKGMRRRAEELMQMCRSAVEEGGSSSANLDNLVRDIFGKKGSVSSA